MDLGIEPSLGDFYLDLSGATLTSIPATPSAIGSNVSFVLPSETFSQRNIKPNTESNTIVETIE